MGKLVRVSDAAHRFLVRSSDRLGLAPSEILDRVLNVHSLIQDPRFQEILSGLPDSIVGLLEALDEEIRALNPGSQYVVRQEFYGYRRSERIARGRASERSQIFVSVVPRKRWIMVILPLDPDDFVGAPGVRDLSGVGHHGVGDLCVDLGSRDDLRRFLDIFDDWLKPW